MAAPKNAPLYQQIYDEIKDAIEKGAYKPKERIPSELELAEQYEVSRITVRRAVEELCSDGYLVKQQGRGTFVSTPHINRQFHASALQSFTDLCESNGMKAGAHVVDRQIVPARQYEQEFFGLEKNALLLHIKRIRTADGEPIFEENVFLPFEPYRELLTADLEDKSIFAEVERVGGMRAERSEFRIDRSRFRMLEAVRATPEQAAELAIAPHDPLLNMRVGFVTADDEPVFIGKQYYVGSRYVGGGGGGWRGFAKPHNCPTLRRSQAPHLAPQAVARVPEVRVAPLSGRPGAPETGSLTCAQPGIYPMFSLCG